MSARALRKALSEQQQPLPPPRASPSTTKTTSGKKTSTEAVSEADAEDQHEDSDVEEQLDDDEDEDEVVPSSSRRMQRGNVFDLLMSGNGDDDNDNDNDIGDEDKGELDEDDEDKGAEEHAKKLQGKNAAPVGQAKGKSQSKKAKSKAKSKAKAKGKGKAQASDSASNDNATERADSASSAAARVDAQTAELDEIDLAIREVQKKYGDLVWTGPAADTNTPVFASGSAASARPVLFVEAKNMKADVEMRRMFGAATIAAAATGDDGDERRGGGGGVVRRNVRGQRPLVRRTYWLAGPKDTWPLSGRGGISMEPDTRSDTVERRRSAKDAWFRIMHSSSYSTVQEHFLMAVNSYQVDAVANLLNMYPYHVGSLVQLSEVSRMHGDLPMALELIERALFALEMSFHSLFNPALGTCRLSYRWRENRDVFLAIFRYLQLIGQRGCWRTALEYCKFMLSLDPYTDPMGVLLMIDFYALRAGEEAWLCRLFSEWDQARSLSLLPNFAYSIALAKYRLAQQFLDRASGGSTQNSGAGSSKSKKGNAAAKAAELDIQRLSDAEIETEFARLSLEADKQLEVAMLHFPDVLPMLLDKCNISAPGAVFRHELFKDVASTTSELNLHQITTLYVERSFSLWKEPEVAPWLLRVANSVMQLYDAKSPVSEAGLHVRKTFYVKTPLNVVRHIVLSDLKGAIGALTQESRPARFDMHDPLPPPDSESQYTERTQPEEQHALRSMSVREMMASIMASLMPGYAADHVGAVPAPRAAPAPQARQNAAAGPAATDAGITTLMQQLVQSLRFPINSEGGGMPGQITPADLPEFGDQDLDFQDEDEEEDYEEDE
ncbi:transcription factor 25 [Capsaspora owczarzaki ATCC 30864]|uniref:Transcription factor 25 n=1 Tax=Capsaspora owczarzaki (strain ATCC 30864) TaxID=595528 RepID=A0A0D2WHF6_CAPO3|nr:transcription factor 25 [Capsaspora owczarzaki ATCC 30864]KJE89045.1 transcription factor 25 [Capsaspora owczarzaki ATCC 30864]|eukprot:XP_004365474.2 transcription factor 25 [Capsaspora owczarzaki ATCC 30864]